MSDGHVGISRVLRRFGPYLKRERGIVTLASLAMIGEIVLRLLEPWPLKFIFDELIARGPRPAPANPDAIARWAGALVGIVALGAMAEYARRVGFALAGNRVLATCRADMFAHLQRLSLSFHGRRRTGDIATRLTGDIGRLQDVVSTAVLPLVAHAITVVAIACIMLVMEWRLALVAFAVLPLFWLSTIRLGRSIRSNARSQRERQGEIGAIATETIGAIGVVQSLSGEGAHAARFSAPNRASLLEGVTGQRLSALLLSAADVFIAIGTALILWFGAVLVLRQQIGVGDLLVFLFYHKNMTRPIRNIAKYSGRTAKALASAERIVEILDATPMIADQPGAVPAPRTVQAVAIEDARFAYEPPALAVDGVSLEARRGAITALVGRSGAGKSTLMNLLLRLYAPDAGRILCDGRDIREFTVESWRRAIAIVPQETTLFSASVRDNITFGLSGVSRERIEEAARLAGADEFIAALPEGYDSVLGERGGTLSEGQRQRLAIARAAVREAPILIFDEPTASLDAPNRRVVRRAIHELARDRVCFVITHDLGWLSDADQIVMLDHGRVVEFGTRGELLARDGVFADFNRAQHRAPEEAVDA